MRNYIIKESKDSEAELIIHKLVEYNLSIIPQAQELPFIWINRVIRDEEDNIIAGINSKMYCWNCLYIDSLWVKAEFRKEGLGSKLLKEVEKIALKGGCKLIHLDTFDFQAKDFYLRHGYKVFGILNDCPEKHKRYYMKKCI